MAVLDACPGLRVEIVVNKLPLQEWDDDEEAAPGAVTKYVEAQSGAEFRIWWSFSAPFTNEHSVQATFVVDGEPGRSLCVQSKDLFRPEGHFKRGIHTVQNNQRYHQNYCFTALNVVEESDGSASIQTLRKNIKSKGCITVTFHLISSVHKIANPRRVEHYQSLSAMGAIPEKAFKGEARSHQTTLGRLEKRGPAPPKLHYDVLGEPIATFSFKYRSRAALKALRIHVDEADEPVVDKAATLGALEQRPEGEMSPEELREVVRRLREREARNVVMKRERSSARSVKREHSSTDTDGDDDEIIVVRTQTKRPRVDPEVIVLD